MSTKGKPAFLMKKFYITTPIYYVNDKPHVGHAYTTLAADVFARYYRTVLGAENVFFLTGTDEHGAKVAASAAKNEKSPQQFVNEVSQLYKDAWKDLGISYDSFIRTTDSAHKKLVSDVLTALYEKGFIYKNLYKGIYCVGCEKYLSAEEIVDGKCPLHPNLALAEQEEENYFFKLSEVAPKVEAALESGVYAVLPEERKNEIRGKLKSGINDISISRVGLEWGIPLPWDKKHTVYVWVDALLNYLTATESFEGKKKFWPPDLQLMAKDILWFHALIWEAMLLAAGYELPKQIFAHGFFTIDGQKMSKSLGNTIDPRDLVREYGVDGARYLLLSSFPFGADGDISLSKFREKFNADLANGLGNLVSRVAKLCEKLPSNPFTGGGEKGKKNNDAIATHMEARRPDLAVGAIWEDINAFNKDFNEDKPWTLDDAALFPVLHSYIERMLSIARDLEPFLPSTSATITAAFSREAITKPASLFERIKA